MGKKECNWTKREWIYFILLLLMLAGVGMLIGLGVDIVHRYRMTLDYEEAECSAVNVTDHGYRTCSCGKSCSSEYPCVGITVNIYPSNSSEIAGSRLYQVYTADYENEMCSFHVCNGDKGDNYRDVGEFVETYGNINSNDTYTCLYNPNNPKEVILERPTEIAAIMSMLWPSLLIVVCAGVVVTMWLTKKSKISTKY